MLVDHQVRTNVLTNVLELPFLFPRRHAVMPHAVMQSRQESAILIVPCLETDLCHRHHCGVSEYLGRTPRYHLRRVLWSPPESQPDLSTNLSTNLSPRIIEFSPHQRSFLSPCLTHDKAFPQTWPGCCSRRTNGPCMQAVGLTRRRFSKSVQPYANRDGARSWRKRILEDSTVVQHPAPSATGIASSTSRAARYSQASCK